LPAQLTDRISWGGVAKVAAFFMPMAISLRRPGAVIWKLVMETRAGRQDQIGVLNAVWLSFDGGGLFVSGVENCPPRTAGRTLLPG